MIIFHAQFDSFRSRATGDRILSLCAYEEYLEEVSKVTNSKIGTNYLVMMVPVQDEKQMDEWRNETAEETLARFRKHMNALIEDCAQQRGEDKKVFREFIKDILKKEGQIKESTNELTLEGLARVISRLKKYKHGT